jgi:hypothetical protein
MRIVDFRRRVYLTLFFRTSAVATGVVLSVVDVISMEQFAKHFGLSSV